MLHIKWGMISTQGFNEKTTVTSYVDLVVRVGEVLKREGWRRRRRQEPGGRRDALNGRNRCLLLSTNNAGSRQLQGLTVVVVVGLKEQHC